MCLFLSRDPILRHMYVGLRRVIEAISLQDQPFDFDLTMTTIRG